MNVITQRITTGFLSLAMAIPFGFLTNIYLTRDGIRHIGNEVVCYKNGELLTGKQTINNKTFYFSEEGIAVSGWVINEGKRMYFDETTKEAKTGVSEVKGQKYNFSQEGTISTGWQEDGSYKDGQGFVVKEQIIKEDGVEKVIDKKGKVVNNGWREIEGQKFYFKKDGTKAVGVETIEGHKYYFQKDGTFLNGWVSVEVKEEKEKEKEEENTEEKVLESLFEEKKVENVIPVSADSETIPETEIENNIENNIEDTTEAEEKEKTEDTTENEKVEENNTEQKPEVEPEQPTKTEVKEEKQVEKKNKENKKKVKKKKQYYNKYGFLIKDKLQVIDGKTYAFDKQGFLLEKSNKTYYVDLKTKEARKMSEWEQQQEEIRLAQEKAIKEQQKKEQELLKSTTLSMQRQVKDSGNKKDLPPEQRAQIAGSALAQASVNKQQDCTMLATNALASVGINFHGWPSDYASLGRWVSGSEVQPGDLAIYSGHIAVVSGQGTAVHGGFNAHDTVNYSIACANKLVGFIRVQG